MQSSGVISGKFREVEDFTFTTQENVDLSLDDLKGKVWIANFIFTSCAAECLVLSARIAELRISLQDNEDVEFVSFSVDPQTDSPERLKAYADRWHADPDQWHFLTGDTKTVDDLVINSFLLPVTRDPEEANQIASGQFIHSNKFAVVDRAGVVRAYVDGLPEKSVDHISSLVFQLLQEPAPVEADSAN